MSTEEVMRCTPRYFAALVQCNRVKMENAWYPHELMYAQVIAMVGNTGFRTFAKARRPDEFMPSRLQAAEVAASRGPKFKRRKASVIADECRSVFSRFRA